MELPSSHTYSSTNSLKPTTRCLSHLIVLLGVRDTIVKMSKNIKILKSSNGVQQLVVRLILSQLVFFLATLLGAYGILVAILTTWFIIYAFIFQSTSKRILIIGAIVILVLSIFLSPLMAFVLWMGAYGDNLNPNMAQHLAAFYIYLLPMSFLITGFSFFYSIKKKSFFFFFACLVVLAFFFVASAFISHLFFL